MWPLNVRVNDGAGPPGDDLTPQLEAVDESIRAPNVLEGYLIPQATFWELLRRPPIVQAHQARRKVGRQEGRMEHTSRHVFAWPANFTSTHVFEFQISNPDPDPYMCPKANAHNTFNQCENPGRPNLTTCRCACSRLLHRGYGLESLDARP